MTEKNNIGEVYCPACKGTRIEVYVDKDIQHFECACGNKWVEIVSRKKKKRYRVFHYWLLARVIGRKIRRNHRRSPGSR